MKHIITERSKWDRSCLHETMVRKMTISPDDEDRAFAGMVLHPDQAFVPVKHVMRSIVSLFTTKPTSLFVFQAAIREPLTGRRAFIETSVGDSIDDIFEEEYNRVQEVTVYANGFILDPFASGRTKITSIRCELGCTSSFVIPL